jgi:RNA polymerase-binding transcription factor DksA
MMQLSLPGSVTVNSCNGGKNGTIGVDPQTWICRQPKRRASSASPDTADLASEIVVQDLVLSLLGSTNGALADIEAALERIDHGRYGRCEDCGEKIPAARLEVLPHTPLCVECAARQERGAEA